MDTSIRSVQASHAAPSVTGSPSGRGQTAQRDDILFVGMNGDDREEALHLRKQGSARVTALFGSSEQGKVAIHVDGGDLTCDLKTAEGATAFADSLHLPTEQRDKLIALFREFSQPERNRTHQTTDALDELAQIAQIWAQAEHGGRIPSRMVLSGHNASDGLWGDGNGTLTFDMLERLADVMPKAARQVEDLHLSACWSGGEADMERYRAILPNVKTIWAYTDSAPGTHTGAKPHLSLWETATRGSRTDLDRKIAAHTRRGDHVTVWTVKHGYQDGQAPQPLDTLRQRAERYGQCWKSYFNGQPPVDNPSQGLLREYYNSIQRVLHHPQLPKADRPDFEAKRDQSLRLLYYSKSIAPTFAAKHDAAIRAGFSAMGMAVPDFAHLSRNEALAKIAEFATAVDGAENPAEAAVTLRTLLVDGLRDLKSDVIPLNWV